VLGDLLKLTGIVCVTRITYFDTFVFSTATPIALAGCLFATFLVAPRVGYPQFRRPVARALAVFLLVTFPGVSLRTLRMYVCRDVAGTRYLEADYRLRCDGPEYQGHMVWAAIVSLLVPFGFPVGLLAYLLKNRSKLGGEEMETTIGFLYRPYKERLFFWEPIDLARKLLLSVSSTPLYFGCTCFWLQVSAALVLCVTP
jgi:hypothetical protein